MKFLKVGTCKQFLHDPISPVPPYGGGGCPLAALCLETEEKSFELNTRGRGVGQECRDKEGGILTIGKPGGGWYKKIFH